MTTPKPQTKALKSQAAADKLKAADMKALMEARKLEEYTVGRKQKFVMKGAWQCDMKEWQQSDILEKQYDLKEGAIVRWCTLTPIPRSYYIVNCNGFFISPDLVATYHLQMEKNKAKPKAN